MWVMLFANALLKLLRIGFFFFLSSCLYFYFFTWVELIGGGLSASRSLVESLVSAVRGFTSWVTDSVFNFGLPGPLPA